MQKICIYCGKTADTKDHVPPRALFPSTKGLPLATVPACKECNKRFSLDETFFRDHMSAFTAGKSLTADLLFDTKIKRSIQRRPSLAQTMFNKMTEVDYYSKAGIYLGKRTAIKMNSEEWDRIYNIMTKIIKGLVYLHFGEALPDSFVIKHYQKSGDEIKENHSDILQHINWVIPTFDNVFRYGFARVGMSLDSIWVTDYYKNAGFMTFVRDPKNIATKN